MSNKEENKNYVTPYAFGVNDNLLGKALASPTRRLFSIFVDIMVVGSLTLMSTTVMAACICIVSAVGAVKARKKDALDGRESFAPKMLSIAAILSALFIVASLLISDINFEIGSSDPVGGSVQSSEEIETNTEDDEPELNIVDWAQATLTGLGLSFGWAALYFSAFTAWFHGQTLGKILFRIRVVKIDGDEISLWESFGRYGGYSAGLATGLLGFLQVIWDPNKQAIHDKISETVVIDLRKPDRSV